LASETSNLRNSNEKEEKNQDDEYLKPPYVYFQARFVSVQPPGTPVARVKLLPPLLSSIPPLPEDSLREEDGTMGIFNR